MSYLTATTLDQALSALAAGPVSIIAGGTDWFPAQGDRPVTGDLLDITRLPELRGISQTDMGWRIGAATTWTDIIRADLPAAFDGLKLAAREVGSIQIQNAGTIAGNLCNASPAADGVPPLLTLNAEVELCSANGSRVVPLSRFLQGVRQTDRAQNELVSAVHIPTPPVNSHSSFVKLGARKYLVISICMVAVLAVVEGDRLIDIRIAIGAASPVAQRLTTLEDHLRDCALGEVQNRMTADLIQSLTPITDVRASADYRLAASATLIRRAVTLAFKGVI